jgi:hypothetical protein
MEAKIGSLVRVMVDFQLSRNIKIMQGDYGIIIGHTKKDYGNVFDYLVACNGIQIYLFNYEIELVI